VYYGSEHSDHRIREDLDSAGCQFHQLTQDDLVAKTVEEIANGKIVGWFQGRMEFGPRALGNRSILYHAKDPAANDWLNKQLRRSEFMPFAPVTLTEHAHSCYEDVRGAEHAAEFMTITFNATKAMREQSPACVHVDGTARPQLVSREVNPSIHETLTHYHELSGIPSIINTSFNMHEEPIVCTPADAVRAFRESDLDYLALGDYLLRKEGRDG
jgi:carbamoyltransferase